MKKLSAKATATLYTQAGSVNKMYVNAIRGSRINGDKIYPCSYAGSGRYITLRDYTSYITTALKLAGYKFEAGNNAPRGGKEGNFIKCSSTAMNFLILLTK